MIGGVSSRDPASDRAPQGPGRINATYVRFFGQAGVDGAIAALAEAQHGVVAFSQLQALGLKPRAIQARAASRRLHRIHHGVYAITPRPLLKREGIWHAAVLACGPGAVLSHRSAAALHDLRAFGGNRVDVTVPSRSGRDRPGIHLHRATTLIDRDVTVHRRIPCTTVARTLLDLAAVTNRDRLKRALDQAEVVKTFDLTALRDQLDRNPFHPGAKKLKSTLNGIYVPPPATWSEFERRFYALTDGAQLPRPEVNVLVDPGDGDPPILVDFLWRSQRVAVETDGKDFHLTRQAFETDRRRDQRLTVAGWRPVRTTWLQLTLRPDELERTLIALILEVA
jgi:hypothetical protein